jgi:hypothetical protein
MMRNELLALAKRYEASDDTENVLFVQIIFVLIGAAVGGRLYSVAALVLDWARRTLSEMDN